MADETTNDVKRVVPNKDRYVKWRAPCGRHVAASCYMKILRSLRKNTHKNTRRLISDLEAWYANLKKNSVAI